MKKTLITALLAFGMTGASQAGDFTFWYDDGVGNFSGLITGALNGNLVTVTSITDVTILGEQFASLDYIVSVDNQYAGVSSATPTVSLDGSYMDILACVDISCATGFDAVAGDQYSLQINNELYSAFTADNGGYGTTWNASNWTMYALPEPSETLLLAAGLFGLAGASRRKRGA